jgi:DnaJ like chaperone protein
MDLRQIFTNNTWWGKLIGAYLGYLIAGPVGTLFGVLIGNVFDRGLSEHFSRPHWSYHEEKRKHIKKIFFTATFSIMGHISKADGRVSEKEIQMAKKIMQELELNHSQRKAAQQYFNEGKQVNFNFKKTIQLLQGALRDNPGLLRLFIDIQYRIAKVDQLSIKKQQVLNTLLNSLGFASLNQQHHFYEDFTHDSTYRGSSSSHQQSYQTPRNAIDHAYGILKVTPSNNQKEIKRAYQKLISVNHPDKLIAKGLPEEMIKKANEKTQKIRKAYEQICENRGW